LPTCLPPATLHRHGDQHNHPSRLKPCRRRQRCRLKGQGAKRPGFDFRINQNPELKCLNEIMAAIADRDVVDIRTPPVREITVHNVPRRPLVLAIFSFAAPASKWGFQ
jgi:hypothetical protein